jgi:hypothetical protein
MFIPDPDPNFFHSGSRIRNIIVSGWWDCLRTQKGTNKNDDDDSSSVADPDVYSGSNFFPSGIPDPNLFHSVSWIRLKGFKYFNPK